jgi:hypothetical protein
VSEPSTWRCSTTREGPHKLPDRKAQSLSDPGRALGSCQPRWVADRRRQKQIAKDVKVLPDPDDRAAEGKHERADQIERQQRARCDVLEYCRQAVQYVYLTGSDQEERISQSEIETRTYLTAIARLARRRSAPLLNSHSLEHIRKE